MATKVDASPTKTQSKPVVWVGCARGKYQWDDSVKKRGDADVDLQGEAITKYSWSDGKKVVSIYLELPGIDDVPDSALHLESDDREVLLVIPNLRGKRRKFTLAHLPTAIDSAKVARRKGKDTVVLKLHKKEERSWQHL
mmetsp:Transcript_85673/g.247387  ORF Transcript_85673/g.247387 Transcript_85673/m.247387 type:complete len:139 (-) Transcript_85673:128-544(-)